MTTPFIGQISFFGFNFAPNGWAMCLGQLLPIAQNTALFSILGTTYGGNGTTTYALPNFQGRVPMAPGTGPGLTPRSLGETGGEASVTLTASQIPSHNHPLNAGILSAPNAPQNVATPTSDAMFGLSGPNNTYSDSTTPNTSFAPAAISTQGASQPHTNMQPYQVVNICIALFGLFPSRS